MLRVSVVALSGVVFVSSLAARQPSPSDNPNVLQVTAQDFVGADACKECHGPIHSAWSKTKHAKALDKLTGSNRLSGECIGCHVTGTREQIAADGDKPSLPHVQCEACHGPGRRHVEAARIGSVADAPTEKIEERTCTRCHNETSPHYKPFFFNAMKGLVHR